MGNITTLYDKNFVVLTTELKMIKKKLLQHRCVGVLDYLMASQGGMCAIVRTACCNYIGNDTKAEDAAISHIEKVERAGSHGSIPSTGFQDLEVGFLAYYTVYYI